ncbi:MAG: GNAT family protein [Lachnospiraceae bacterium]|nr:GNAT family protein [Lachnospiraceae bacterium]
MQIRKTKLEDLDEVMQIYDRARRFMAQTGNPTQWGDGYPKEELIREDIAKGVSYVAEFDGRIETVFMYYEGEEADYRAIEGGSWKNDEPYGVIHRIASRGEIKGAGSKCLQWGFEQCGNLRIDTHDDNVVMQHVLEKSGFEKCGRIYLADGSPRVAYQKSR